MVKKIKVTTWISLVIHLLTFSAISYSGYLKWGWNWSLILVAIVPPLIFFYQNIKEDEKEEL